ncbi:hypothetical protein Poli38472_003712 [Pythium oligandrum]|uniref:NELF-A N-terminal domain-containing protein n=1 Tax=Pythium oligandrum TaxID=41045 RepID=A0A8K1CLY1_PYTOL|nr:hypothetical protein Poli38472_003712 [Pythium oligandrum]|eukprot:TMW65947.1 hypothetical protein Poli38472_003712 [Pythium oligandrum]
MPQAEDTRAMGDSAMDTHATGVGSGVIPRRMNGAGVGGVLGASGAGSGRESPSLPVLDAWLVHKLKNEWSSCELGEQLTRDKIAESLSSFLHLETPVKVRLLLAFLSMRKEDVEASKVVMNDLIALAEEDSEEWVKIGAGIVKQYLFLSTGEATSGSFLHEQLEKASAAVLKAVDEKKDRADALIIEDFFCHENAYLSPSVRPELTVQPAAHFTVCAKTNGKDTEHSPSERTTPKKPLHRPQIPRPTASTAPSRIAQAVSKSLPPPKKNMSDVSSEIRRKADAGRFKRQRSRISMIDIDEVKQIESEKAQKAEEQRKKLKAAKETKGPSGTGAAGGSGDKNGGEAGAAGDEEGGQPENGLEALAQYSEQEEALTTGSVDDHSGYAQNGTQVLLNAAFHSTQDVMQEVVAQQEHQGHVPPYQPRQAQPLHLRGFEPEDVQSYGGYGFGNGNSGFGSQFGDQPGNNGLVAFPDANSGGFFDEQSTQRNSGFDQNRNGGFLDGPPEYWR